MSVSIVFVYLSVVVLVYTLQASLGGHIVEEFIYFVSWLHKLIIVAHNRSVNKSRYFFLLSSFSFF